MDRIILVFALIHVSSALWSCKVDDDCSSQAGSVCVSGSCECPGGQQPVFRGTRCVGVAPYLSSPCYEDIQCDRLWANYECRKNNGSLVGTCACLPGNHFFLGRCWPTKGYREACERDEECLTEPRDPYALKCNQVCVCADGYYERQRGECRKIATGVGEGCVVDDDCHFTNGTCNVQTFSCTNMTASTPSSEPLTQPIDMLTALSDREVDSVHNINCTTNSDCTSPSICSFGACVCPRGFYKYNNKCYAELGTPSTPDQCDGLLAVVIDGVCTCRPNFFFEQNMRDCTRVTRRITDSCVTDGNCGTFGAQSRCGPPKEPWGLRTCECISENAVWNADRNLCRLFAGVGEQCEADNDCLAGDLEITCEKDDQGQGFCRCPPGLTELDGLCLTSGLVLGDTCQASQECNGTANAVCSDRKCACATGFQQDGDYCAPVIGGPCAQDTDCVIQDTVCLNTTEGSTCQCRDNLVAFDQQCYTVSPGQNATCSVSIQCQASMGNASSCVNGLCVCTDGYHYRDEMCWPRTELFQTCSRTSQCYLREMSEVVTCRNGLCQCDFDHPYSEELRTCTSSASSLYASFLLTVTLFILRT
ncbi:unnamed protein product [Leptosia nina]|uniref:EB domain-containing protein n=1 Tax=Leptosia nina TaxID=320188 RepID=A0AAV1JWR4_9NEOP